MRSGASDHHGILIVDKPSGCTSHDVVQRVRKALRQRSVGHAGTLDPLATGVLVVAVGEATKLVSHLQMDDKRYRVTIALGTETDSLDADGSVLHTAPVPELDVATVQSAAQTFLGRHPQEAPKLSAIKVEGRPLHRRTRRGEEVEAPVREVELYGVDVESVTGAELQMTLHSGKGFYVRSFARDLARKLGTVGHVRQLRRTASGRFTLDRALFGDNLTAESIAEHMLPLRDACSSLQRIDLTAEGVEHARHGRPVPGESIVGDEWRELSLEVSLALFGPDGEPVALGRREGETLRVTRGFASGARDVVRP